MRNRKICVAIFVALSFVVLLTCSSCGENRVSMYKEVKVLSMNTNILRGKIIGNFLSSPDGHLTNDVIIVGIQADFRSKTLLFDVELTHSEVAYYENRTTLPMNWTLDNFYGYLCGYLNGREIVRKYLSSELMKQLYKEFEFDGGN